MQLLFNLLNDIEDTKDVYQEVFLKVFMSIGKYRFESKFYTWLYRIAINTAINFRKKRKLQRQESIDVYLTDAGNKWEFGLLDGQLDPEQKLLNFELSQKINQSLNELSKRQKAVFILRYYQGYKLSEIAEIMNCSEGTVKNYMFRSVQKLKKKLQEYQQL